MFDNGEVFDADSFDGTVLQFGFDVVANSLKKTALDFWSLRRDKVVGGLRCDALRRVSSC